MNNKDALMRLVLEKLDKLDEKIDAQALLHARNSASLEEHIKRTNLLEQEIRPIKAHVALVNAGAKILTGLVGTVAVLGGIAKTFGLL